MAEQPTNEDFDITEMDEKSLDEAAGAREVDVMCGPWICNLACNCPLDGGP